jgi:hypothetical protein
LQLIAHKILFSCSCLWKVTLLYHNFFSISNKFFARQGNCSKKVAKAANPAGKITPNQRERNILKSGGAT